MPEFNAAAMMSGETDMAAYPAAFENPMEGGYYSAAAESPLGDVITGLEPIYEQYTSEAAYQAEQSIEESGTSQQPVFPESPQSGDSSNDSPPEVSDEPLTSAAQTLLTQVASWPSSSETSPAASGDNPSVLPSSSSAANSLNLLLPVLQGDGRLFDVRPDGEMSFSNVTVVAPIGSEGADEIATTSENDVSTIVTLEQTYNGVNDWVVHQSWAQTSTGPRQATSDAADGSETGWSGGSETSGESGSEGALAPTTESSPTSSTASPVAPRILGNESYSVTIINGTKTIRTWTLGGSYSVQAGSLAASESDDDAEPWAVPDSWVAAAATPVGNVTDSTAAGTWHSLRNDSGAASTTPDEDSSGVGFSTSGTLSATVTETLVTRPDGSTAIERTTALTFSASLQLGVKAAWSIDRADVEQKMSADDEPLPPGLTVDIGGSYQFWAKASIAGTLTATVTIPDEGLLSLLNADFETSFRLGASAAAGGNFKSHQKLNLDSFSGTLADQTDEFQKIHVDNSTSGSGLVGMEFWVVASTEDGSPDASNSDQSDNDSESEPTGSYLETSDIDVPVSNELASPEPVSIEPDTVSDPVTKVAKSSGVGTGSASSLTEGKGNGIQFSLEVSGSYESKKDEKFDSKQRTALVSPAVVFRGSDEQHFSEVADSSGDLHFVASLGTERTGIGFSVNVADSSKSQSDRTVLDVWSPGETPPVASEVLYGTKRHQSESEQGSSSRLGIALGADATGDPGDALHYKTDASGFSESDITFIARVENYLNSTGATYPWVERTYQRQEGRYRSGLGLETVIKAGSAELTDYSSVGTQTLPDVPAVVLVTVQPGTADLQKLIAEYRDRATKVARWETQLAKSSDQEMKTHLADLIAGELAILADIAVTAKAAGVTQAQLDQIIQEAQTSANDDPIEWQPWDGGESTSIAFAKSFFGNIYHRSGGAMTAGVGLLEFTGGAALAATGGFITVLLPGVGIATIPAVAVGGGIAIHGLDVFGTGMRQLLGYAAVGWAVSG
jgi:hypothetical protein